MTDREALERIRVVWLAWARGDNEAWARIAEILEAAGLPLVDQLAQAEAQPGPERKTPPAGRPRALTVRLNERRRRRG